MSDDFWIMYEKSSGKMFGVSMDRKDILEMVMEANKSAPRHKCVNCGYVDKFALMHITDEEYSPKIWKRLFGKYHKKKRVKNMQKRIAGGVKK